MAVTRMQQKRGTAAEWASTNPVLADGEIGFERDTGTVKVGNGIDTWANLVPLLRSVLSPTAAEWTASIRVLAQGEVAIARDTQVIKVGDGTKTWSQLPAVLASTFVGTTGGSVITVSGAAVKGLTLKAAVGQTANLTEWQDNAGAVLSRMTSSGELYAALGAFGTTYQGGRLNVSPSSASELGVVVKLASAQTGSALEVRNSAGMVLLAVGGAGKLRVAPAGTGQQTGASLEIHPEAVNLEAINVYGLAAQAANLQTWRNSTGTILGVVNKDGGITAGGPALGNAILEARLDTQNFTAARGFIVRGASGQFGNLAEFQNSAGTAVTKIGAAGDLVVSSGGVTSHIGPGSLVSGTILSVRPFDASQRALIVQAQPSQTANLTEFQQSNGFSMLAVGPGGQIKLGKTTDPGANTTDGQLFVNGVGELYYRGTSGTLTRLALA